MAEGDVATAQYLDGENITALALTGTTLYLGTNKGRIYKFDLGAGTLTAVPIANLGAVILSMIYYSNKVYVGVEGGKLYSVATA